MSRLLLYRTFSKTGFLVSLLWDYWIDETFIVKVNTLWLVYTLNTKVTLDTKEFDSFNKQVTQLFMTYWSWLESLDNNQFVFLELFWELMKNICEQSNKQITKMRVQVGRFTSKVSCSHQEIILLKMYDGSLLTIIVNQKVWRRHNKYLYTKQWSVCLLPFSTKYGKR